MKYELIEESEAIRVIGKNTINDLGAKAIYIYDGTRFYLSEDVRNLIIAGRHHDNSSSLS